MIKMNLEYLLYKHKITQKKLADSTNIPKNTINRYFNETWTTINKEHLDEMCKYFNCEVQDILEYKDESKYNFKLGASLDDSTMVKEPMLKDYKMAYGDKTQKQLFYDYIDNHFGYLSNEDIRKYALFLCEDDTTINYLDTVTMLEKINNQYNK